MDRIRDFGLRVGNLPTGEYNAITDVPGVRVGHTTLISGEGRLGSGKARCVPVLRSFCRMGIIFTSRKCGRLLVL